MFDISYLGIINGNTMNILITGAGGYIGSMLCHTLKQDHDLVTVDNFLYGQGVLVYNALQDTEFYNLDVDEIPDKLIQKADVIIPLAAYVGMPSCAKNYNEAIRVNLNSIETLVDKLRNDQLIIYPNTNSGYGSVKNGICTEETPLNGISHYAKLKDKAEQVVLSHPNSIVFRLATVFGVNPFRHRVDLLVNTLVYESYFNSQMDLFDNEYRRNYISVHDVVRSFLFSINNVDKMSGQVYNIGSDKLNATKQNIASIIQQFLPQTKINLINKTDIDQRDYEVSSEKIYKTGFKPLYDLKHGINELVHYYSFLPKNQHRREQVIKLMKNV